MKIKGLLVNDFFARENIIGNWCQNFCFFFLKFFFGFIYSVRKDGQHGNSCKNRLNDFKFGTQVNNYGFYFDILSKHCFGKNNMVLEISQILVMCLF